MMLQRLKASFPSMLRSLRQAVLDSRFGHLLRMLVPLRRRAPLLAVLLGCALAAGLYGAGLAMQNVFAWLGGWRWPHLLLAVPAALFVAVVMTELYAAAILAAVGLVLRLGYDIGRARFGAALALAASGALLVAGLRLLPEGVAPPASGDIATAAVAVVLAMLTLWFARTYLRPAARGFRSFHVDLVEARQALESARHGA